MKKEILLENRKVSYTLRMSKRARRMRLAVYCDGSVVVTSPSGLKESFVERFIREKTEWLFSKLLFFQQYKNNPVTRYNTEDYMKYKNDALLLVTQKIGEYARKYGFRFNRIRIKNQKTCWGSCSRSGNLNFNYKIIFLPDKIQDYIIVHELCHLKEFNHSRKKYWALVERIMPNYHQLGKELRINGLNLF